MGPRWWPCSEREREEKERGREEGRRDGKKGVEEVIQLSSQKPLQQPPPSLGRPSWAVCLLRSLVLRKSPADVSSPTGFVWSWLTCSREGMTPGRQEEGQLSVGERPASY